MIRVRPAERSDMAAVDALLARSYPRLLKPDYPPSVLVTALPLISRAQPALRRERGKMVWELRPDIDWDKGRAVCWLLEALGRDPSAALFIGDDLTDETVFRALSGRGLGIVVSETERPTAADLRLSNPAEVQALLGRLADAAAPTADRS